MPLLQPSAPAQVIICARDIIIRFALPRMLIGLSLCECVAGPRMQEIIKQARKMQVNEKVQETLANKTEKN